MWPKPLAVTCPRSPTGSQLQRCTQIYLSPEPRLLTTLLNCFSRMKQRLFHEGTVPTIFTLIMPSSVAGVSKPRPGAKSNPLPIFVNKVSLGASHTHSLTCHLGLLSHSNGRVESGRDRLYSLQSLNFYYQALSRKCLPIPMLTNWFLGLSFSNLRTLITNSCICREN